jgi:hypothetical protein
MKTKNHMKYKKKYIVIGESKFAPYTVTIIYGDYNQSLDEKLISLAERNTGEDTGSGYGFGQRDLSFDFFTEKGARQFVKKVRSRYGYKHDLEVELLRLEAEYKNID